MDLDALQPRAQPSVFSVPPRFAGHMVVVAVLAAGDAAAADAPESVWRLRARPAVTTEDTRGR